MVNFENGQAPYVNEDNLNLMQKIDVGTVTIAKNTTISNGYEVTLPLKYQVGNNSLELRLNSEVLKLATSTEDGHYKEVGTTGALSNKIQFYRTSSDGSWTLDEAVTLTAIVRRSITRGKWGARVMSRTMLEKMQDTGWKNVSLKGGFEFDTNFPLRYRIKAGVLYIAGVLVKSDGEAYSSANTNVFSIPVTLDGPMHFQAMVSSAAFELTSAGGQASGYINASGGHL